MRTFLSRVLEIVLRRSREQRMDAEIEAHLDLLADEYVAKGLPRQDAEFAARRAFGGVDQVKERYRDRRGFPLFTELAQDTRYAVRLMARERWFTAATVVALSLGIGATTTMVTILYCMNVRGLPFHEAASLVGVTGERTRSQGTQIPLTLFEQWRSAARSFEILSAEIDAPINLGDEGLGTDQFAGTYVSFDAFALLRERPVIGRDFLPDDDHRGAAPVAIVGYRVWTDRYGSDPSLVGRTVRLNGAAATIIGVMPVGFAYPVDSQIWRPLSSFPDFQQAVQRPVRVVGRLAPGVSAERAQAELSAILSTLTTMTDADRKRRRDRDTAQRDVSRQDDAAGTNDAAVRRGGGTADRLQSCGQSPAGALGHAGSRTVDALRARRRSGSPDPSTARRKRDGGAYGRNARRGDRSSVRSCLCHGDQPRRPAVLDALLIRSHARRNHHGHLHRDRHCLRAPASDSAVTDESQRGPEPVRTIGNGEPALGAPLDDVVDRRTGRYRDSIVSGDQVWCGARTSFMKPIARSTSTISGSSS